MMDTRYGRKLTRRTLVSFDYQMRAGGKARVAQ